MTDLTELRAALRRLAAVPEAEASDDGYYSLTVYAPTGDPNALEPVCVRVNVADLRRCAEVERMLGLLDRIRLATIGDEFAFLPRPLWDALQALTSHDGASAHSDRFLIGPTEQAAVAGEKDEWDELTAKVLHSHLRNGLRLIQPDEARAVGAKIVEQLEAATHDHAIAEAARQEHRAWSALRAAKEWDPDLPLAWKAAWDELRRLIDQETP